MHKWQHIKQPDFHWDDVTITTPCYDPVTYQDDFEDGFYGEYLNYSYNMNDERILEVTPEEITRYVTSNGQTLSEYEGDDSLRYNYIYANGQRLARVDASGGKVFFHNDYLGSARMMTNSNGTTLWKRDYYPFGGKAYAYGSGSDYEFCGKERDDSRVYAYC